jgi:hypothetical protein
VVGRLDSTGIGQRVRASGVSAASGDDASFSERFFVLTHKEICEAQAARNHVYAVKYQTRYGRMPDFSKGVDNILVTDLDQQHENAWHKIINALDGPAPS